MAVKLYKHQKEALQKIQNGSILCGGVGSGKSITGIAYYFVKENGGKITPSYQPMPDTPKDLYIITTARKRDEMEWEGELNPFLLSTTSEFNIYNNKVIVDSWNNIKKYIDVKNAFFIFDEQRVVGSGTWVKSFIKITKNNNWILLSATPGDVWMDYVPVFIANGYYKNRTEFIRRHVIYSRWSKFPKVDRYIEVNRLEKIRDKILVYMKYEKPTVAHNKQIEVNYDKNNYETVLKKRWNIFEDEPIQNISGLGYLLRRVVNSDKSRSEAIKKLSGKHQRLIIFYNFNYELDLLRALGKELNIKTSEWNGHKHESLPKENSWLYLVQYTAGAEGWNCIETNAIVFYSQNYSYKTMIQSAGRIDRLNTPYRDLYYYHLRSKAPIDLAIKKALSGKRNFNEKIFLEK